MMERIGVAAYRRIGARRRSKLIRVRFGIESSSQPSVLGASL